MGATSVPLGIYVQSVGGERGQGGWVGGGSKLFYVVTPRLLELE